MHEVLNFLNETKIFFVATIEGNEPKVRPFGFVMDFQDKLYFCTSNQKNVYQQLKNNSNCEISAANDKGDWIRVKGKVVFDNNMDAKKKVFEIMPALANLYKGAEDPTFEVFYLDDAEATFASLTGTPPRTVKF